MRALLAAVVAALLQIGLASAQEGALVYWPMVTDGTEYRRISYPAEAGPLVFLAETTVVLEARLAEVDYWPITREYVPNFASGGAAVEGTLELVAADGSIQAVEPQPYLVWHPEGVGTGPVGIVSGQSVGATYERYVTQARASAARVQEYGRVVAAHQAAVEAWLKMAGERRPDLPPPPPELDVREPEPYRSYSSEPAEAAIVSLPAGDYTIRIRDGAGQVVAGSERALVSLAPTAAGIGYVVRPENRWTQPVLSFSPEETIYTTGETDLFVQPVPVLQYDARSYARLFRPQSVEAADASQSVWIPAAGEAGAMGELSLRNGGEESGRAPATGFRVAQVPGRSRGYTIEEFAPIASGPLQPDFSAMRVSKDADATEIALVSGQGVAAGSERPLRRVEPAASWRLFLPALLPLAAGIAVVALGGRKRRLRQGGLTPAHA